MKININFTEQNDQRCFKHWISNSFVTKSFCDQIVRFKFDMGNFCELGFFNEANNYEIKEIRFFSRMNWLDIMFPSVWVHILYVDFIFLSFGIIGIIVELWNY